MKQAFLIIAHSEWDILSLLLKLLDHPSVDIYLHVDSKSAIPSDMANKLSFSRLYLIEKRIDIRWGDISLVKAEMELFKAASKNDSYLYYHLLSGVDLPIKPIDVILDFFVRNKGKEFVGFVKDMSWENRVNTYQFFTRHYKSPGIKGRVYRGMGYCLEKVANKFLKRKKDLIFKKGCNWCSISNEFCKHLLSKESFIYKRFNYMFGADETFLHTILYNSPFRNNIYAISDEYQSCMREIDWKRGEPYTWGQDEQDLSILENSNKLFARKFSMKYPDIIREVYRISSKKRLE